MNAASDEAPDPDQLQAHYARLNGERPLPRRSPQTLRAALWTLLAVLKARRDLRRDGLAARVAPPPALPWGSRTGVNGVLYRLSPTCLERALVHQKWLFAHGIVQDVVVGVRKDDAGAVKAHAWVDGITRPEEFAKYAEIHRIAAE